jgi:tetratricopeptide (TPR) repeat protein
LEFARTEIKAHKQLADQIAVKFPLSYWDAQANTQQLAVRAWLAFAEGGSEEALSMMRKSADLESKTDKEAVTPGEVLPAGDLLGDMLTEMGRYDEAVSAYQAVLKRSANRFYSLYGTGRAAEADGDTKTATRYYELLVALGEDADPSQPRLQHAKAFLAQN